MWLLYLNLSNCENKYITLKYAETVLKDQCNYLIRKLNICSIPLSAGLENDINKFRVSFLKRVDVFSFSLFIIYQSKPTVFCNKSKLWKYNWILSKFFKFSFSFLLSKSLVFVTNTKIRKAIFFDKVLKIEIF